MKINKTDSGIALFILYVLCTCVIILSSCSSANGEVREETLFTKDWKFILSDSIDASEPDYPDSDWRTLDLPHDYSIEGEFGEDNPAMPGGGALPGGIGWYRKTFTTDESQKDKLFFIDFDGVYKNSEVWINGHYLGKRPFGYISFRYELTPYLNYGKEKNVIAVKVDNSKQPNSRWYSGSGIFRNVWLVSTSKIHVDHWGTFVTTSIKDSSSAEVNLETKVVNSSGKDSDIKLTSIIVDGNGQKVAEVSTDESIVADESGLIKQKVTVSNPELWSLESPNLYKVISKVEADGCVYDKYETPLGFRTFKFDAEKGFFLNGRNMKIKGACMHHDLGCLGAAFNTRAMERQLEILKDMGCNAIRTSHNPPAPELLDLCDKMGFIVMAESFDIWVKQKNDYDYHLDYAEWHKKDLTDFIMRDRNHPSIVIWSIGNELAEQWDINDTTAIYLTRDLRDIVMAVDSTRPITAACNVVDGRNSVIESGALDVISYNYSEELYERVPERYPGKPFIATETDACLHTRGYYDMPSDSLRIWPERWDVPLRNANPDFTCSSYDNCLVPWGVMHEENWKLITKYDFIAGMFIWTGFDYLGEPTPYSWPARSSYFGLIDLAGFPKDAYYFYKSVWTDEPVLHIFPHWNWKEGQIIDVWAYTNCDEVELFLNGKSMGTKEKTEDTGHIMWRLQFEPGTIKAVARTDGKEVLTKEISTAGEPYQIALEADRENITADGIDLSFITVKILDENGNLVPNADNLVEFKVKGPGKIAGVDNGLQTSHEPFKADYRKAFNGMCLAVIQSAEENGDITLTAVSKDLKSNEIIIHTK